MEDYINSLQVRAADHSPIPNDIKTTRSHRKWFSHVRTPKKITQGEQIVGTVSEFRIYVHDAMKRHKMYGLKFFSTLRRTLVSVGDMLPMPTTYEETSDILINDRMNEFINSLANDVADRQQLKVVSVLGSACLGKTTLARVLYSRIGLQFDCRAFIRVSKSQDMKKLFQDMLSQLEIQQCPPQYCEEGDLINKIKNYLEDKRYFIIIDDVCSASVWDIINRALPKGSHGSRIITTTQIEDVAFRCCHYQSEHVFEMKPLDDHPSRKLFFNRLFGSESNCPEQFKKISNEIVTMCGGLPLATISIASLLASQPVMTEDLLKRIHESLSSLFSANPTSERTRQALNLSFINLPQYLKTCLLYVSMYQEGYTFCKNDLVKQWMAEGFIHATNGEGMEKVAESYLHQLIGRRFIQPIHMDYNNEVLSCAVHDVVHDLIAQKSAEDNFIVAIDNGERKVALSHKARRLSILFGDARDCKAPTYIINSQVRSLTFLGLFECMPSIPKFKLLRVLNLQLSGYGGSKRLGHDDSPVDLSVISELSRMRYLKIASHLCIKLPDYMEGLHCLETLDIMDAVVLKFGISVYLPHLFHLYLSLRDERNVKNWIDEMSDLDKLKHLQDLRLTFSSARSLSQKENMLVLQNFISGHDNLRTIVVACDSSDKVTGGASHTIISWDDMAPPPLLQRFEFSPHRGCIFKRIPLWVEKHSNLSILNIAVKELRMICVSILRGLPALTALSLYVQKARVDKIIFDVAGFSVLKYFRLRFMTGIAWLKFEEDAMPNLLKLKLVFRSTAIPRLHQHSTAVITIEHMPSVREISIKFGGAVADREYALRNFVSNHFRNPTISMPSVDYCSDGDKSTKLKQQQDEIMEENPDEYYREQSDEIPQDEPDESYKQQPDKIVEEEPDEYDKTLERPSDNRTSRPLGSSSHMHVPGDCLSGSQSIGLDINLEVSSRYPPEWVGSHVFTLDELISATNNFSEENLLGESIFGPIYKGIIDGKIMVAVTKVTYGRSLLDLEYLVTSRNPHMVSLLGYCNQDKHNILVHEYMPRGSLKNHLCDTNLFASVPWLARLKIAVGAAKGLSFLQESGKRTSYGPFNASSILLDSDYSAKLWCFGLANQIDGTMSELDRKKSDVYNFGAVLLGLLSGRGSLGEKRLGSERNPVEWFEDPCWFSEDKLHHIMDPGLEGRYSVRAVLSTARTARWCLRCGVACAPEKLPNMRDVAGTLERLLSDGRNGGLLASGEIPRVSSEISATKSELAKFLISTNADAA